MTSPSADALAKQHLWRTDITGLRALAVLPVLLFHAFPMLCPGGFLGVDIFFVISGYLISGIIFRGLINDSFSYADFYAKRIRRIIPNLVLVLAFVALVGYFFLFADEYETLGKHIYSSAFFYQNFRLLKEAGDYFANEAVTQPLLHLWSLAIEEQFYILFPLIATFVWWISKRSVLVIGAMVASIVVGSFLGCLLTKNASFAFYFPLTRFWEIGVGMVLAYLETFRILDTRRIAIGLRNCLSVSGFLLIVGAMWFYTTEIVTPSGYSLLPVLGTAFLIASHEDSVINRTVLTWKSMIFVGLISYSLYLWHWPLISYLHIINPKPEDWMIIVALILSFVLSILVYVGVENPMRRYRGLPNKVVIAVLSGCLVVSFGVGQAVKALEGLPKRDFIQQWGKLANIRQWVDWNKVPTINANGINLFVTKKEAFPSILFAGDSHVEQYYFRVKMMSEQTGLGSGMLHAPGCYILSSNQTNKRCKEASEDFYRLLHDQRIKAVAIANKWGSRLNHPGLMDGIQKFKRVLSTRPDIKVFVILDAPWDEGKLGSQGSLDPLKYFNRIQMNLEDFIVPLPAQIDWQKGNDFILKNLSDVATIIHVQENVCPGGKCNLYKWYRDDDHLQPWALQYEATWLDVVYSL